MRTGAEVAVFVTRRGGREVLLLHRAPGGGGYWHVVAGGVEPGETAVDAAKRELREETGLVAPLGTAAEVTEYAYALSEEPVERRSLYDPRTVRVHVTCYRAKAADDWEPTLDGEHDDYRWCSAAEACVTLRWPETARALRCLMGVTGQE
jgi:8-oxo-dGTP pyrophosphatase MutT (NUDIX family)